MSDTLTALNRTAYVEKETFFFGSVSCVTKTCEMGGRRSCFEDTFFTYHCRFWAFFAVMDGHSGRQCAVHIRSALENFTRENSQTEYITNEALRTFLEDLQVKIESAASRFDENAQTQAQAQPRFRFFPRPFRYGGSTLTGAFVYLRPGNACEVQIFNVGDSRTYVIKDKNVLFRTEDHRPDEPSEKARIEAARGYIVNGRIDGLAVSRSFGDTSISEHVIATPDIKNIQISPVTRFDLLVCSDGIFERTGIEDRKMIGICAPETDKIHTPYYMCETAFLKGSCDNLTFIHATFEPYQKWQATAKKTALLPVGIAHMLQDERSYGSFVSFLDDHGFSILDAMMTRFDYCVQSLGYGVSGIDTDERMMRDLWILRYNETHNLSSEQRRNYYAYHLCVPRLAERPEEPSDYWRLVQIRDARKNTVQDRSYPCLVARFLERDPA